MEENNRDVFVSEAIVRPTGLIDPEIVIIPVDKQVEDAINRIQERVKKNQRVLITTLTKKFAEDLDIYLKSVGIKSTYVHSDVDTMKRLDILKDLREGVFDVLIGINLLREIYLKYP
jgi:excinuclease ABC subunit B